MAFRHIETMPKMIRPVHGIGRERIGGAKIKQRKDERLVHHTIPFVEYFSRL